MSIYKINYEHLRQQPELTEMLSALERGLNKFGIDFYLVGAVARDVWMRGINNIAPSRTTGDIDFAVLMNDRGIYETLKEYLIINESFHPTHENAFVLIWKDKTQVDLLPFGAIEDEDGKVTVKGTGYTTIHVPGFSEVYAEGLPELQLENSHTFKFCTLPGIMVLKLIAWDDRPEARRSDIKDISDILNHYFNMHDNEIWENHNDLFTNEKIDLIHIAARVMGREMKRIGIRNERLYARKEDILKKNTANEADSKMAAIMVEYFDNTVDDNIKLLQHLKEGFTE